MCTVLELPALRLSLTRGRTKHGELMIALLDSTYCTAGAMASVCRMIVGSGTLQPIGHYEFWQNSVQNVEPGQGLGAAAKIRRLADWARMIREINRARSFSVMPTTDLRINFARKVCESYPDVAVVMRGFKC